MHIELVKDKFLRTTELATLTKRSTRTAIFWRSKLGVKCPVTWGTNLTERPFKKPVSEPIKPLPEEVWRNKEWFGKAYKQYGTRKIAKMIGRSRQLVKLHLRKYNILIDRNRMLFPINPYYNRDWIEEHYVLKGKSIGECAKLAKVNRYTIYNWLVTFGFPIRDRYEASTGERNSNYGRQNKTKSIPQKITERIEIQTNSETSQVSSPIHSS